MSQKVVRSGNLEKILEHENLIVGQKVAIALREYHTQFIEPRLRRIEWFLFPLRLWDLSVQGVRYLYRKVKGR